MFVMNWKDGQVKQIVRKTKREGCVVLTLDCAFNLFESKTVQLCSNQDLNQVSAECMRWQGISK